MVTADFSNPEKVYSTVTELLSVLIILNPSFAKTEKDKAIKRNDIVFFMIVF
jgi:hypothetical protein